MTGVVVVVVEGSGGGGGAFYVTVVRRGIHPGVGRVQVEVPWVRLLDRDRDWRANWGLREWGGTWAGVSVVVKRIVLDRRQERVCLGHYTHDDVIAGCVPHR